VVDRLEVVPVERDVERSDRQVDPFELPDLRGDALCEGIAAAADAGEDQALGAAVLLDDLVRDSRDGAAKSLAIEDLGLLAYGFHGFAGGHASIPFRDYGKGVLGGEPFLVSRN
jgi:hypothetical protein